ncbi:hypothetical protein GCM10025734_48370 [Kitasatospora paranensis]
MLAAPVGVSANSSRSLSRPFIANREASVRCSSPSRETAQVPARASTSSIRESSRTDTSTSGGSSDTDRNEVAVIPTSSPSSGSWAVTRATPAASWERAARNSSGLAAGAREG